MTAAVRFLKRIVRRLAPVQQTNIRPLDRITRDADFPATLSVDKQWARELVTSARFKHLEAEFREYPQRSFVPASERAFLYCLIRSMKPAAVAEVGTAFCGTSEIIARALWENGKGILDTTDPFGGTRCPSIIRQWPQPLQKMIRFYDKSSMDFFTEMGKAGIPLDIVFVDGNHDFEFAHFDIAMASRRVRPGGIIVVDNLEQSGPFYAAARFMRDNPDWVELGDAIASVRRFDPFNPNRCSVPAAQAGSFLVLKAPETYFVGEVPRSTGQIASADRVGGFSATVMSRDYHGNLHYQLILRAFRDRNGEIAEYSSIGRIPLDSALGVHAIDHRLDPPLISLLHELHGDCLHTVEVELAWEGLRQGSILHLAAPPIPSAGRKDRRAGTGASVEVSAANQARVDAEMNDLPKHAEILKKIAPWSGRVPPGFVVDFIGQITAKDLVDSRALLDMFVDGAEMRLPLPSIGTGEFGEDFWFEAVDWIVAAREAKDRFVMITLGAWNGHQAVGSYLALQKLNPMPCKLVAVEPVPELMAQTRRHFLNNGIEPDDHWLIPMAISDSNAPVLFAVAPREMGPQNCFSTNEQVARQNYCEQLIEGGRAEQALNDLLMRNSTGIMIPGAPDAAGMRPEAELKLISAITLDEILRPFDRVDYVESDIQESEILVFPPFMDLLKRKVRRIHVATHGVGVHRKLHALFADEGWKLVFSYEPDCVHQTVFGPFKTGDGVLTVRNPDF